ncbi:hypothetical protein N6H14_16290 [Paenibacillus sp. CC-CFT747]|nr:hypothetical protein N6H14_16290 [Paenibacillus sp. CC-CFT747]
MSLVDAFVFHAVISYMTAASADVIGQNIGPLEWIGFLVGFVEEASEPLIEVANIKNAEDPILLKFHYVY